MKIMRILIIAMVIALLAVSSSAQAQMQSDAPADQAVSKDISKALEDAGIDGRTTSVRVTVSSDHVVYLTGLISDKDTIKLAGDVAAKTAPSYRIVNNIHSSFFDDPNHVTGDKTK